MTRIEFLPIMAYVTAGCGKALREDALDVYFDILGDLPADAMWTAAKRVLAEHPWATFPSITELRQAAVATLHGVIKALSPGEAWSLAWAAAEKIDPEQDGSAARHLANMPPLVLEAIKAYSLAALCYGKEPVGVVRGQFMKIYEQLLARDQRAALLPPKVHADLERRREALAELPSKLAGVLARIGDTP